MKHNWKALWSLCKESRACSAEHSLLEFLLEVKSNTEGAKVKTEICNTLCPVTLILGNFQDDTGLVAPILILSEPDFKSYSERNTVLGHVSLNSLVRNGAFLRELNKGLPGLRGKEERDTDNKRTSCNNGLEWINGPEEIYSRPLSKGKSKVIILPLAFL